MFPRGNGSRTALIVLAALGLILVIGWMARPAPEPGEPLCLGDHVRATTMNDYAARVGCPGLLFQDGRETLQDALREIRRCVDRREHPLQP